MAAQGKQGRIYGGLSSADREAQRRQSLLDAAIDQLIAGEKLTVRGVCARTNLTSRYFYENFRSTDELAETAYDTCVAELAAAVTDAFATPAELDAQIASAMTVLVASLEANPRAGHVLFSYRINNPLISRKRQESTAFFAQITAETVGDAAPPGIDAVQAAHFVVGGVTQLLSVWLNEGEKRSDDDDNTGSAPLDGPAVARLATTLITALAAQLAR